MYGKVNKVIKFIRCFLSDRTQIVKVGNGLSDRVDVTSGVIQGSVKINKYCPFKRKLKLPI